MNEKAQKARNARQAVADLRNEIDEEEEGVYDVVERMERRLEIIGNLYAREDDE